ncbi:UNVERIFIED_CONTAM: hypothetical protein Slati_2400400 [Sesamum latifolium]|uniref:Uncharacterized protein n=1 Tax=Sesamum latifolium TaxID=2727402 RepID=A0AAW2WBT2_9LAMI
MQAVYQRFDNIDPGMMLGEFTKLQEQADTMEKYMENFEDKDDDAVEESALEENDQKNWELEMEDMTVSLNPLSDNIDFNTLRVKRVVCKHGCQLAEISPMTVRVADRSKMDTKALELSHGARRGLVMKP